MSLPPYLNKSFNYTKLTKQQLLKILIDNHIALNVNLNSKKADIIDVYKVNIHDKIDELIHVHEKLEMARSVNESSINEGNVTNRSVNYRSINNRSSDNRSFNEVSLDKNNINNRSIDEKSINTNITYNRSKDNNSVNMRSANKQSVGNRDVVERKEVDNPFIDEQGSGSTKKIREVQNVYINHKPDFQNMKDREMDSMDSYASFSESVHGQKSPNRPTINSNKARVSQIKNEKQKKTSRSFSSEETYSTNSDIETISHIRNESISRQTQLEKQHREFLMQSDASLKSNKNKHEGTNAKNHKQTVNYKKASSSKNTNVNDQFNLKTNSPNKKNNFSNDVKHNNSSQVKQRPSIDKTLLPKDNIYQSDNAQASSSDDAIKKIPIPEQPKIMQIPIQKPQKPSKLIYYVFAVFCTLLFYIKYICPYCTTHTDIHYFVKNPHKLCINLPDHCVIKKGEVSCEKGYTLVNRWFGPDYCKEDVEKSYTNKIYDDVATMLRRRNKEFLLGMRKSNCYEVEEIKQLYKKLKDQVLPDKGKEICEYQESEDRENDTSNNLNIIITEDIVNELIQKYEDVRCIDNKIFSVKDVNFLGLYFIFYLKKIIYRLAIPLLTLIFFIYIIRNYKRSQKAKKELADKVDRICKQIFKAMMNQKQFYIRQRSQRDFVTVRNLCDFFELESKVWKKVVVKVKRNSNVLVKNVGSEECLEWIGPIIEGDDN